MTAALAPADHSADISPCGRYRYRLMRGRLVDLLDNQAEAGRTALFIMLNPSTADAERDDPTIRRCIGFAARWNCRRLVVVNLFAWRATNPRELTAIADPVGPDNDATIAAEALRTASLSFPDRAGPIVAAWGAHGDLHDRDLIVLHRLKLLGVKLLCLGVTVGGFPRHPLYVPADQPLIPYEGRP